MHSMIINQTTLNALRDSLGAEFMSELVAAYLDDTPLQITALQAAHAAGDVEAFRRAAHTIKSTSLNFGAIELAEQARRLETLGRDDLLDKVGSGLSDLNTSFSQVRAELKELSYGHS